MSATGGETLGGRGIGWPGPVRICESLGPKGFFAFTQHNNTQHTQTYICNCDFYTCDDHLESAACHPQMPRSSRPTDFLSRVWREVDLSHCGAKRIAPR